MIKLLNAQVSILESEIKVFFNKEKQCKKLNLDDIKKLHIKYPSNVMHGFIDVIYEEDEKLDNFYLRFDACSRGNANRIIAILEKSFLDRKGR